MDFLEDILADSIFDAADWYAEQQAILAEDAKDPIVIAWYTSLDAQAVEG